MCFDIIWHIMALLSVNASTVTGRYGWHPLHYPTPHCIFLNQCAAPRSDSVVAWHHHNDHGITFRLDICSYLEPQWECILTHHMNLLKELHGPVWTTSYTWLATLPPPNANATRSSKIAYSNTTYYLLHPLNFLTLPFLLIHRYLWERVYIPKTHEILYT